jgi:hypothetical protein
VTRASDGASNGGGATALDRLAVVLAERSGVHFAVATTDADRDAVHALRQAAIDEHAWSDGRPGARTGLDPATAGFGERDEFDDRAVHLLGRRDGLATCCGRLVLPPGPLPTEVACGLVVEPVGRVVDVGRMVVEPHARGRDRTVFLALLAALYLETRTRGYDTGCGMMAPNVRGLVRHLGVRLDVLDVDREYWGAARAPVRFDVSLHGSAVLDRWT